MKFFFNQPFKINFLHKNSNKINNELITCDYGRLLGGAWRMQVENNTMGSGGPGSLQPETRNDTKQNCERAKTNLLSISATK